jgi:hypothetical protein
MIEVDIKRTFNQLGYFNKGQLLHQPLKNVLAAFAILRPDIGYV